MRCYTESEITSTRVGTMKKWGGGGGKGNYQLTAPCIQNRLDYATGTDKPKSQWLCITKVSFLLNKVQLCI